MLLIEFALSLEKESNHDDLTTAIHYSAKSIACLIKDDSNEINIWARSYWNTLYSVVKADRGRAWVSKRQKFSNAGESSEPSTRLAKSWPLESDLPILAYLGKELIVQMFLKDGVDVNACNEYFGTALYAAAFQGNSLAVELLLNHGANVN